MLKSICLGVACLTLTICGVTRATEVNVDGGKYGDYKCFKMDNDYKCYEKIVDFCKDHDKIDVMCGNMNCHDLKLTCDDKDGDKDGKDTCKMNWLDKHDHCLSDVSDNDNNGGCHLVIDSCCHEPCDPGVNNAPPAVPAPASAGFGGLGLVGVMLIAGLRSRRTVTA